MHPGPPALAGHHVLTQPPPQRRLPALVIRQRTWRAARIDQHVLPRRPGGQPVGPIDLVLIEQIRQPSGKLKAFAQIGVIGQEALQRMEHRLGHHHRQQPHQPPHQTRFIEGRSLGHGIASQHRAVHLPQEARRQQEIQPRRNAAAAIGLVRSQRELEPLGNTVALHQHRLGFERRERIVLHPPDQQIAQRFGLVTVDRHQAGMKFSICHVKSAWRSFLELPDKAVNDRTPCNKVVC